MIILSIVSFYLEQLLILIFDDNHILIPLFSLVSMILSYQLLKKKSNLLFVGLVFGLIYDIALTQTLFLNTLIFLLMSFIIIFYNKIASYNMINTIIITIISIILYRVLTYIPYIVLYDKTIDIIDLFRSIYSSLIINILYVIILQLILKKKISKIKNTSIYSY